MFVLVYESNTQRYIYLIFVAFILLYSFNRRRLHMHQYILRFLTAEYGPPGRT